MSDEVRKEGETLDKLVRLREAICIFTDLTKKEASKDEQRSKLLFDTVNQVKQELNATSKIVQDKLHAMDNTPLKKVVTHRFEPTSKNVLLFIGGLALSLVISPDFVIASPKNLHQRAWRFSDALPSTLSECIHPCSEVA